MGRDGDAGMGPERVILRQRLDPEHVQCGMADLTRGEGGQKGVVVDQGTPAGVQDDGAARQEAKGFGVQDVLGLGCLGQQGHRDLRAGQGGAQVGGCLDAGHVLGRPAPPGDREIQRAKRPRAGGSQRPHPQHRHRPFPGQRRTGRLPHMRGVHDVTVHPQMMAQRVAHDPFHHALGQPGIDHPAQGLGQGGIADDALDPGPQAQHGLAAGEGREILQRRRRGVDDVIDGPRVRCFGHQAPRDPRFGQQVRQNVAVLMPQRGGGKEDQGHGYLNGSAPTRHSPPGPE